MVPRRFVDEQGTEWEVWEVGARRPLADAPPPRRARGGEEPWLCFESATQRRRLARYPRWWEALSAEELGVLCRAASPERLPTGLNGSAGTTNAS